MFPLGGKTQSERRWHRWLQLSRETKCVKSNAPELGLALLVEAMHKAVRLALQRPPQGDAAPAAQLLRVPRESLHRLRQGHELGRGQTLQGAVLLESNKGHTHTVSHMTLRQVK